jgi:hypothetical protein
VKKKNTTITIANLNRIVNLDGLAHEIFAVSQLLPNEGISDAVHRIKSVIAEEINQQHKKQNRK